MRGTSTNLFTCYLSARSSAANHRGCGRLQAAYERDAWRAVLTLLTDTCGVQLNSERMQKSTSSNNTQWRVSELCDPTVQDSSKVEASSGPSKFLQPKPRNRCYPGHAAEYVMSSDVCPFAIYSF